MKITMIGDRGCGKTTFMAGLYRELTDPNFRLNIRLSNDEQRKRVDAIAQNLSRGYYPSATSFEQQYNFDFTIDGVKILDFTWFDYRGGVFSDIVNDSDSRESQQLLSEIENSDGLLIFIDNTTRNDPKWNEYSNYWMEILHAVRVHATYANENNLRSLGIIYTKKDVEVQDKTSNLIEKNVAELIDSLPNRKYLYGIEALSFINKNTGYNTLNIFLWIMMPFILKALQKQAYKIEQTNEMSELLYKIRYNYDSAGWLDDFLSGIFGGASSRQQVTACVNMLKRYPIFQSSQRRFLISSFLNHWNNRSIVDDLGAAFFGGRSQSSIAQREFNEIIDIWFKFDNDIESLYGDWSDIIWEHLDNNNGFDKGGYELF